MRTRVSKRLLWLMLVPPTVLIATAFAYRYGMTHIEGTPRTFLEALEWASETLTTTGYGRDARWQHPGMILFVIGVQFLGVVLVYMLVPLLLLPMLESRFEQRLPHRAPRGLRDHIVILHHTAAVDGLVATLDRLAIPTLVVMDREDRARTLREQGPEALHVVYGAPIERLLDGLALDAARAVIADGDDEQNAALVLALRSHGYDGPLLALASDPHHRRVMALAGATDVLTPRHALAATLADLTSHRIHPRITGIEALGGQLEMAEMRVTPESPLADRTLAEAQLGRDTGVVIIGQWRDGRLHPAGPEGAALRLTPRTMLIALGTRAALARLADSLHPGDTRRSGPILVVGAGEVGRHLVQLLRAAGEPVQVIDRTAADDVDLVGDIRDPATLAATDLDAARGVVLAVDSDQATLFATLLIREQASQVPLVARVNAAENVGAIRRAGADVALSISQVAGQMLSRCLLDPDEARQVEMVDPQLTIIAVDASPWAGRTLAELDLRAESSCSVVAIERVDALLVGAEVRADLRLAAGDRLHLCGAAQAIETLRRRLAERARGRRAASWA